MDLGIIEYCLQPSPFFDVPPRAGSDYALVTEPLPDGWLRADDDTWCYLHPAVESREQGWKIHVSARPQDAEVALHRVRDLAFARSLPFKFLRSRQQLLARNSKYGDRTASGKFIAIYPQSDDETAEVVALLDEALHEIDGPAVLSDCRVGSAPVFVRYGAFIEMSVADEHGHLVPAIRRPDGTLVPDERRPVFRTPDWVDVPAWLAPSIARRASATRLPYRVHRALHFSNGGGVYEASPRHPGPAVLLKEARPHAGLDESGRDAVARLQQEAWALERLQGADYVPDLVGMHTGDHHVYLAREFAEGASLVTHMQRLCPLLPGARELGHVEYAQWALAVGDRVAQRLADMHARGVVFGDVHPNNVLLAEDGTLTFIDFETATEVGASAPQRIGAPGFRAPEGVVGVAADRYGLACLRLSLLLPMTIVLSWGPSKVDELLAAVHALYDRGEADRPGSVIPPRFDAEVRADLGVALSAPGAMSPPVSPGRLVTAALDLASPERSDRLYPGGAQSFRAPGGGITLGYGAAGVLSVAAALGEHIPGVHVDWLERRIDTTACGPGLVEGWAGVALTLSALGRVEAAHRAWQRALAAPLTDATLARGGSGLGIALLQAGSLVPDGTERAEQLAQTMLDNRSWGALRTRRGAPAWGLLDGPAGVALFLVRLAERTGQAAYAAGAVAAVVDDLNRQFPEGSWRTDRPLDGPWQRATLHRGSAGTAMVLADLTGLAGLADLADLADLGDLAGLVGRGSAQGDLRRALDHLGTAHDLTHHEQPGLFTGRAGMMAAIAHVGHRWPQARERWDRHRRLVDLYTVDHGGVCAVLGDHGLKLSCDLGTGSAGVAFVLAGGSVPFCF